MRPDSKPWGMNVMWDLAGHLERGRSDAEIARLMRTQEATVRRQIGFMELAVFGDKAELSAITKGD